MVLGGSECSVISPILNEPRVTDGPVWRPGDSVSLALGLGSPQNPVLWCQAPWDGPLEASNVRRQLWAMPSDRPK